MYTVYQRNLSFKVSTCKALVGNIAKAMGGFNIEIPMRNVINHRWVILQSNGYFQFDKKSNQFKRLVVIHIASLLCL